MYDYDYAYDVDTDACDAGCVWCDVSYDVYICI